MPIPLVSQLWFARSEFMRCLEGLSPQDAVSRHLPMNCISWMVGHLANQEHRYWVISAQGKNIADSLQGIVGFGKPASTPPYQEMLSIWHSVTSAADVYLSSLEQHTLTAHFVADGNKLPESIGTMLQRNIYHYWFHTGEAHSVRQILGHTDLPQFVGDMSSALYKPEA